MAEGETTLADELTETEVETPSGGLTDGDAVPSLAEQTDTLLTMLGRFKIRLLQDWTIYQILIVLALIAVSFLIYRLYKPRIRALLGAPHGWPKWVLRILALVNRRLWLLIFVVLAWATVFGMQEFHRWPSHRYFIQVAASLATAWFLIAITTRLIRNRLIRRLTKWAAWVYVTLEILNLRITARNALDALALEVGETRISALTILTAVVALAALFALAGFLSRTSASRINKIEDMSPSIRVLFIKAVQLGLFIFAFVIGLRVIGFDIGNLALLSGAIGLGIGFGLQKIVSNLVSGVIILLDKSIKPGDVISLEGTFGWITQLGARYASVLTRDGREYLIPNEDFITSQVINWSHSSDLVRLDIKFGVSYDSDPHEVKRIAGKAPLRVKRVVTTPAPVCHMINLGDSSIDFVLRFWIKDSAAGLTNVRGDTYLALWDALAENKIQIPFPRQDITILSQEEPVNPLPEV